MRTCIPATSFLFIALLLVVAGCSQQSGSPTQPETQSSFQEVRVEVSGMT
jgi:hypothetical protein